MAKISLQKFHWLGGKSKDEGLSWDEIINHPGFPEFMKRREMTEYELSFMKQGYDGEPFQALYVGATMPFGKHQHKLITEVHTRYLEWCLEQPWINEWGNLSMQITSALEDRKINTLSKDQIKNILNLDD